MLNFILSDSVLSLRALLFMTGILIAFFATIILTGVLNYILPHDAGKALAVNGQLSKGKPRGAGLIFVLVFVLVTFIFVPYDSELLVYLIIIIASMMSGFLDDASKKPWNEYKKGLIDAVIAFACAFTYVKNNGTGVHLLFSGKSVNLPEWLYIILAMILIWAAINVVNCTDGVDGLCAMLAVAGCLSFIFVFIKGLGACEPETKKYAQVIMIMTACILGYLWYNAHPSRLLMGDAGSRAIGIFFAILSLKSGYVLLFIPFCIVFIVDGGIGIIKVSLLRFLKIRILPHTITPLHDNARKNRGWSDTQVVIRYFLIQVVVSMAILSLFYFIV